MQRNKLGNYSKPTIREAVKKEDKMASAMQLFHPGEDPKLFFLMLDPSIAANKEEDTVYKNLALYIDITAVKWIMAQPDAVRQDKATLVKRFKEKFTTTETMSILRGKIQIAREDTEAFIEDMQSLCEACGMSEATMLSYILKLSPRRTNPSKPEDTQCRSTPSNNKLDRIKDQLNTLGITQLLVL